jgi:hypothetical protein
VPLLTWFQRGPKAGVPVTIPGDTIHYYAINLLPVPDAALSALYPTAGNLFGGGAALLWFNSAGVAGGQAAGVFPYPFLTQFASLFALPAAAKGSVDFSEYNAAGANVAGAGADVRVIAHYYEQILGSNLNGATSIGISAQLVAVPITFKSFNLFGPIPSKCAQTGQAKAVPCSTFNFVVSTLSQIGTPATTVTLMDHLPLAGVTNPPTPQGSVVIARQIGGANFQMFYFAPSNVSVSSF